MACSVTRPQPRVGRVEYTAAAAADPRAEREGLSRDQTQARAAASRDTEPGDRGTDRALAVTQWGLSESGVSELRFSEDHKLQTLDSTSRTNISVGGIS